MASGVYRFGSLPKSTEQAIEFQADGKTATVNVVRIDKLLSLLTNGKSDGSIQMDAGPPSEDEIMMTLLGALPQLLAPEAKRIATIGFGTGMSTHVLLASRTIESVDTIEIEPAMLRAAPLFRPFNARALDDPRSHVHFEDAKTYFSSHGSRYDVILSEPSNPWVSGVASLFSIEFYRDVRRHLRDGGLLFQWVQAYEMTPVLLATILTSLEANFTDYELWMPSHGDLLVVAAHRGKVPRADARALANPALAQELARFEIRTIDDVLVHRVAGAQALAPYFRTYGAPPNSDFNPIVDLNAPQARFQRATADEVSQLFETGLPLVELFDPQAELPDPARMTPRVPPWLRRGAYAQQAKLLAAYLARGDGAALGPLSTALANDATLTRAALIDCKMSLPPALLRDALASVAWLVNAQLPRAERERFWHIFERAGCRTDAGTARWLAFHSAVGAATPEPMAQAASALLADPGPMPIDLTARVVGARLAALILMGEPAAAQREMHKYRGKVGRTASTQAMMRLLIGQMDHGYRPAPASKSSSARIGAGSS
jgi:spermidine synthase